MDDSSNALRARNFPSAQEEAALVPPSRYAGPESAYRLAFTDNDFLLREELRPVRMQLELLKPEMIQREENIESTIVMFGSARILSELQSHGVDEATMSGLKAELVAGEDERAWEVWRRKFRAPAADAPEAAKQMRFLQQRGFSHGAIQYVMRRAKKMAAEDS